MISLHMIVKNEEQLLPPLLTWLQQYVEEMIIVDTGSTDRTAAAAKIYTKKVLSFDLDHNFAEARNYGLAQATMPWIFQVDADEWPSAHLLKWVREFVVLHEDDQLTQVVEILRENFVGGKPIGLHTYEWHARLFRRGLRFVGRIHERLAVPDVRRVQRAPEMALLLHHKTVERQERQNVLYMEWEEQRAICRAQTSS